MLLMQTSVLALMQVHVLADDPIVTFPDANLEAAIRQTISKPSGELHVSELAALTSLEASNRGIINLTGLEYCKSLSSLSLYDNQISDITPVAGLTNLSSIALQDNQISNLTPLAGLTNVTHLTMGSNQISNLTPLNNLTNLTHLALYNNHISNITPLVGLKSLNFLVLDSNQISDLTPLASLTNLTGLMIEQNQISNLTPLAGLNHLSTLFLSFNQISNLTPLAGLTNVTQLYISNNQIGNLTPLAGLTGLQQLDLDNNKISDIGPLVDNYGVMFHGPLYLRGNPLNQAAVNIHIPILQARGVTVVWDGPVVVTFPDAALEAAIRRALEKWAGDIYSSELASLTKFSMLPLAISGVVNLSGIEYCTHLTQLWLCNSQLNNLTPLAGLTNLQYLYLINSQIRDLTPLAGLINLRELRLNNNQITDIEPLVNNAGLSLGDCVGLGSNPLSQTSIILQIPKLQTRGVTVLYTAANITNITAMLIGYLSSLGTFETMKVSFQWGPSPGNYSDNTFPKIMRSPGMFSDNLTGLTPATIYYYRSMGRPELSADNEFAPVYGSELSFTTSGVPGQITTTTGTGSVIMQSNLGNITSLSAISAQTLPDPPSGVVFPHGLVYCAVTNITPGSTVTFTITFPAVLPANMEYWKYEPLNGWFRIPIASRNGNVITIQITDGGLGDADGVANGVIIDPGGVAIPTTPTPPPTPTPTPTPTLPNPLIGMGTGGTTSHGSSVVGPATTIQPVQLPNIQIQSASISETKVAPGIPITVSANIANRGTVNGTARVKVFVNGEEDSSQGITVESGGNRPVYFTVNRNQPGTYTVYIGSVLAGSFTVEDAIDPNIILFISLSLIGLSLMLGVIMIARRKSYY